MGEILKCLRSDCNRERGERDQSSGAAPGDAGSQGGQVKSGHPLEGALSC